MISYNLTVNMGLNTRRRFKYLTHRCDIQTNKIIVLFSTSSFNIIEQNHLEGANKILYIS